MSRVVNRDIPAWKSMTCLGRIACGTKNEKNIPINLDYFLVIFDEPYAHLQPIFEEMYGNKPQRFENCFLLGNNAYGALNTSYEKYAGQTCMIRCNGEEINMWVDHKDKTVHYDRQPCQHANDCGCKIVARFNVMLRDFCARTGVLGAFKFVTHSNNNVDTLTAAIDNIGAISDAYNVPISQVPFAFYRKTQIIPVQDKNNVRINKPMSLVAIDVNFAEIMRRQSQQLSGGGYDELPAGDVDMETGETNLSLESFLAEISATHLVLSPERFAEECKALGFETKEAIGAALMSKKAGYQIKKDDPTSLSIALGYLMKFKDVQNPWQTALTTIYAEFAEIPFD